MKITKLVLGLGIVSIALVSCKSKQAATTTTKTVETTTKSFITTSTEGIVAKGDDLTDEQILSWPHMDVFTDGVPGMSLDKAYEFVKGKEYKTVIVGIVDSGVDIEHEDLKDVVWTNTKEIPNNGKDDDDNGYIDDIHGWNFLGGDRVLAPEQLEITRLVKKQMAKFDLKEESQFTGQDLVDYKNYKKMKAVWKTKFQDAIGQKAFYGGLYDNLNKANVFLVKATGKEDFTMEDVNKYADNEAVKGAMMYLPRVLSGKGTLTEAVEQIKGYVAHFASQADTMYNLDFKGRVTGDNPDDWNDKPGYGNNIVLGGGKDELHGTHVAGIVAASRNNGIGMNGVANHVQIMTARAVPDGDEYDKDVAKAIRYVVDNGAKVVNMSFGKAYSPHSDWVYDAFKYAAEHDVLLIKAAGNDGHDIDLAENLHFPTDSPVNGATEITDNIITVGAMTRHLDKNLCATFSNYGKTRVDIFAPGLEIYSTVPKDNGYKSIQGTSMASPEVAGVAALVRSYYPKLTAKQVKYIIMNSGIEYYGKVIIPGSKTQENPSGKKANFNDLSVNGRILNAYNALKMADRMNSGKL